MSHDSSFLVPNPVIPYFNRCGPYTHALLSLILYPHISQIIFSKPAFSVYLILQCGKTYVTSQEEFFIVCGILHLSYKLMYNTYHKKHGQSRAKQGVNVHIIFLPWRKQCSSGTAEFPTVSFLHLYYTDCMFIAGFWLLLLSIYFRISSVLLPIYFS